MIRNIIFDFGDIFINLDKEAVYKEMSKFGFTALTPELDTLAKQYEIGAISTGDFISSLERIFPKATSKMITEAWNSIILDFPKRRLKFIEHLKREKKYKLFLLSNTNELHIDYVIKTVGMEHYKRFKACFEEFYLSHEINLRKPNAATYQFVIDKNKLKPADTLFIDDTKENIAGAEKLGIRCWHLEVGKEDVTDLKTRL
ncbi:MAG: HAD family phosphatase [Maribacter sp.]